MYTAGIYMNSSHGCLGLWKTDQEIGGKHLSVQMLSINRIWNADLLYKKLYNQ